MPLEEAIQNANDFVKGDENCANVIIIIQLQDVDIEKYIKTKNVDYL